MSAGGADDDAQEGAGVPDVPGRDLVTRRGDVTTSQGTARSTESVSFGSPVLTWADLPAVTHRAVRHGTRALAEQAGTDGMLYEVPGAIVQVLRAWRLHSDRLYVVIADRPVRLVGEDAVPVGSWRQVSLTHHDAAAEVRRRVGWVPTPPSVGRYGAGAVVGPAAPPAARGAAQAWPHLPAVVREGAERAVPLPEDWLGQLTQEADALGVATRQEIVVLRRDAGRALVVRATREREPAPGATRSDQARALATAPWFVEQLDVRLAATPQLGARREPAPWE